LGGTFIEVYEIRRCLNKSNEIESLKSAQLLVGPVLFSNILWRGKHIWSRGKGNFWFGFCFSRIWVPISCKLEGVEHLNGQNLLCCTYTPVWIDFCKNKYCSHLQQWGGEILNGLYKRQYWFAFLSKISTCPWLGGGEILNG